MTEAVSPPSGVDLSPCGADPSPPPGGDGVTPDPAAAPAAARSAQLQPYLHEHIVCVRAPGQWLSPRHGDLLDGVDGLYVSDRRVLSRLRLTLDGEPPTPVAAGRTSGADAWFMAVARGLCGRSPDPVVVCERRREVTADGGTEHIRVENRGRERVEARVVVTLGTDLAAMGEVKSGTAGPPPAGSPPAVPRLPAVAAEGGLCWQAPDGARVDVWATPPPEVDPVRAELSWSMRVPANGDWSVSLRVRYTPAVGGRGFRPTAAAGPPPWHAHPLVLSADDRRAGELVRCALADLDALRLCDPADPRDTYFAAGSPWYLTLFGRDALWSALLALPLGVEPLAGTLRTLARRQGTRVDPGREEAPGKILHELRPVDAAVWLPPVYYGTVDATPLFVAALAEAWRWGMPAEQVAELLPAAERALDWVRRYGDPDGDNLVEYVPSGTGLMNQGWKDSGDGVQWADGRLADRPLALCEVQGYAYRAAVDGAALLAAFGRPAADQWLAWADRLARRFREAYWVPDAEGGYPAIALDAGKRPVDGPASNMGHLLGTGLLSRGEEARVADRLLSPALASGYGLRTLADSAAGFNPLAYHAGSVWPHDTAIAALGLARAGHRGRAGELLMGVLAAAAHFEYRLPELYGGHRAAPPLPPVPYPASCRPQAWAAAVGPALVRVLLGIEPDIPAGRVTLTPVAPSPVGGFEVHGVRLAGGALAVRVDTAGRPTVLAAPPGVEVVCELA